MPGDTHKTAKAPGSAEATKLGAGRPQATPQGYTAGEQTQATTAATLFQSAQKRLKTAKAPGACAFAEPGAVRPHSSGDKEPAGEHSHASTKSTYSQPRAAIYARVSTVGNGQSPEMQLRELHEYCNRRGWQIAGEYVDAGISGATDSRPELNRLMADAHRRRFDVMVCWKFDRLARSVSHLLRALETFKALGIEFCSYSEQLDTSTPAGKMVFTVLGAVAELERSLIAERVRAGIRNARAKGKRLGRPRTAVNEAQVRKLRNAGLSWRAISKELRIPLGTLHRAASGFAVVWENPGRRAQDGGAL